MRKPGPDGCFRIGHTDTLERTIKDFQLWFKVSVLPEFKRHRYFVGPAEKRRGKDSRAATRRAKSVKRRPDRPERFPFVKLWGKNGVSTNPKFYSKQSNIKGGNEHD